MPPARPSPSSATYSERLHLPVLWWVGILAMAVLLGLEIVPLIPVNGWVTLAAIVVPTIALLGSASLTKLEVASGTLRAGKWSIPCTQVASVEELDQRNTRRFAGPSADPAATSVLRPWLPKSVRVICVSNDPPYALISTRRPERLSAAVIACATRAADGYSGR